MSVTWGQERVTGYAWAKESRTVTVSQAGTPVTYRQVRNVKLRTKIKRGYSTDGAGLDSEVEAISPNPIDNPNTSGVIYDCRVTYNPATGLVTKTTVERVDLAGNSGHTGYWINEERTVGSS